MAHDYEPKKLIIQIILFTFWFVKIFSNSIPNEEINFNSYKYNYKIFDLIIVCFYAN